MYFFSYSLCVRDGEPAVKPQLKNTGFVALVLPNQLCSPRNRCIFTPELSLTSTDYCMYNKGCEKKNSATKPDQNGLLAEPGKTNCMFRSRLACSPLAVPTGSPTSGKGTGPRSSRSVPDRRETSSRSVPSPPKELVKCKCTPSVLWLVELCLDRSRSFLFFLTAFVVK